MRVTCERCLRRYDVPDATVKGRKIRARCKCGARVVVQDEERAAQSVASGGHTTGAIQRPVRWFVDITSWEPIAMDLRQLVRAFDTGRIDADTLVWRKGMPDWRRLREVEELAERLMGTELRKGSSSSSAPPGADATAGSAPPHVEVPPEPRGEHAVAAGRSSAPPPPERVSPRANAGRAGAEQTGTLPNAATLASRSSNPPAVATNDGGARRQSRPEFAAPRYEPRTITQTGLPVPPEFAARRSAPPPAEARSAAASEERADTARAGTPPAAAGGAGGRPRNQTPAGGQRRPAASDETPAQKPSSISVPPGTISQPPPRTRTWRVLAVAAVALGGLALQHFVSGSSGSVSGRREEPGGDGRGGEPPLEAQTRGPAPGAPVVPAAPVAPPSAPAPSVAPPAEPAPSAVVTAAPPVNAPAAQQKPAAVAASSPPAPTLSAPPVPKVEKPAPRPPAASPIPQRAPAPLASQAAAQPAAEAATAEDEFGIGGDVSPTAPQPGQPRVASPAPAAPASEAGAAEPAPPAPVTPTAPPAAAPQPPQANTPPAPRAFDAELARQQMGIAAWKASTCRQLGPARGAGEVSVLIESWGRVVRVTHDNPAFVDNAVGLCVMQAYQQIQVPPFDGGARSLKGSFVVE